MNVTLSEVIISVFGASCVTVLGYYLRDLRISVM